MKVTFERPHPLSPSPQMWRGGEEGEKGGEVKPAIVLIFGAYESTPSQPFWRRFKFYDVW
jgi:hypothetical protein